MTACPCAEVVAARDGHGARCANPDCLRFFRVLADGSFLPTDLYGYRPAAGPPEPLAIVKSRSGTWHIDSGENAQGKAITACGRLVMFKDIDRLVWPDTAFGARPYGQGPCCMCEWPDPWWRGGWRKLIA